MKQSNKLPKTGIVARCNLNLEIEDERVSYEILAPPRSKPLATDQVSRGAPSQSICTDSVQYHSCSALC